MLHIRAGTRGGARRSPALRGGRSTTSASSRPRCWAASCRRSSTSCCGAQGQPSRCPTARRDGHNRPVDRRHYNINVYIFTTDMTVYILARRFLCTGFTPTPGSHLQRVPPKCYSAPMSLFRREAGRDTDRSGPTASPTESMSANSSVAVESSDEPDVSTALSLSLSSSLSLQGQSCRVRQKLILLPSSSSISSCRTERSTSRQIT